ncbi:hypothetical protein KJ657_00955 [Patescibacteria group bacterium]|nr:hypothetical protein [Patescibacteria group bacterium]MBU1015638.1 hypothetical protein [Patescibacteria group bacterium]MBU1684787.1 hypothetical protein [Patescibacteria group bacterium]MBU1938221.1 hypothetical protein [Patescibacteria group bacterium]
MKLSVAKDQSPQKGDLIEFTSIRDPEIVFMHSYEQLIAMGVRQDIANSLASYAAFQGRKFDAKSPILVHLHEEIGHEPSAQGNEPLFQGRVAA